MSLKILIVDDSSFARRLVREMLSSDAELEVVGEADNGNQAQVLARELKPDAMVVDLVMPNPDGLTTVDRVLKENPIPIVVFSNIAHIGAEIIAEIFQHGILDVVQKPENPAAIGICKQELISKVKAAARSKSTFEYLFRSRQLSGHSSAQSHKSAKFLIAIVASAGSPAVLMQLLKDLSDRMGRSPRKDLAAAVALHIPELFLQSFVSAVEQNVACHVRIAKGGDMVRQNSFVFSPSTSTLCLKKTKAGAVARIDHLKMKLQPHFDAFLESAGEAFSRHCVAVVLSGMGDHGLLGAKAVKAAGGKVIVQDPATAGVSAMPQSVLSAGIADASLPIGQIADRVLKEL